MGALNSKVEIWNQALDVLREQPLSSPDDDDATAKWFRRNYDQQRDYLLGRQNWKFALARASLAADSTSPPWGWLYRYLQPNDLLKLIPPTASGEWMGTPISYELESGYILTNATAPLRIRYIRRVTVEGEFTNGFCEVLSLRLAYKLSHWLTGKQSMAAEVSQALRTTIAEVKAEEAFQLAGGQYYDDDLAQAREAVF